MVVVAVVVGLDFNLLVALFDEVAKSDFFSAIFILSYVSVTDGDTMSLH